MKHAIGLGPEGRGVALGERAKGRRRIVKDPFGRAPINHRAADAAAK